MGELETQVTEQQVAEQPQSQSTPKRLSDYANTMRQAESPDAAREAFDRAAALEKELHATKEALKASESKLDPAQFREELRSRPKDALSNLGVDFNTVLDGYLQQQVQNPEPVVEPERDPQEVLAAKVGELEQKLRQRELQELQNRELSSISSALQSTEAPALRALAASGQPVGQWILNAAIQAVQQGRESVDYGDIITAIEKNHRAYFESLASVYGGAAAKPAPVTNQPAASTITNKLTADPPLERREPLGYSDARKRAIQILSERGWKQGA